MASVELTNHRFTVRFILSALFVPLLCQSILQAQVPSRAELLEAEREAKVEEVRPPERTTIERGMRAIEKAASTYENIKGRDPGLHYTTGNLPTGSGLGFGLGYTYRPMTKGGYSDPTLPNLFEFKIDAAYSTREVLRRQGRNPIVEHRREHLQYGLAREIPRRSTRRLFRIRPSKRARRSDELLAAGV